MTDRYLFYWIKFDNNPPIRIRAKTFLDLQEEIARQVAYFGRPYEWIIRDY